MTNTYSLNSSECYAPTEEGGWGYCGAPTCRNQYITCADEGGGPPTVDGVTGSYRSDYASDGSDCTSFLGSGVRGFDFLVLEEVEVRLRLHREEVEAVQEQVHRRGRRLEQRRLPRRVRGLL